MSAPGGDEIEDGASPAGDELERLKKRYDRERRARRDAEGIAERVTGELYASMLELERLNHELTRTNDELQALNRSMRDFVAIASHDLRGPLSSILGFAAMLSQRWKEMPQEQIVEFLTIIRRQGEHLNRLVEDLLTVSKIEAGALDVHAEVVRLRDAMQEAIDDFTQHAAEIILDVPSDLSAVVDPDHLQRIIVNFLTNAIKYGKPPVEIEARDAGEWVEIRVRDHGLGVPVEFVPRLFGRFARADNESTRAQAGTGLGLSIVVGLANANGGETWYEANEPNGSCFAVRLPKAAA